MLLDIHVVDERRDFAIQAAAQPDSAFVVERRMEKALVSVHIVMKSIRHMTVMENIVVFILLLSCRNVKELSVL